MASSTLAPPKPALPLLDNPRLVSLRQLRWQKADATDHFERGLARQGFVDLIEALVDGDRALQINGREIWANYLHHCAPRDVDLLRQALANFDAALKIDPHYFPALAARGFAWQRLGDQAQTEMDFQSVLQGAPCGAQDLWVRGLTNFARGDLTAARIDLDEAFNQGWRSSSAYLCRGQVRQQRGDLAGALADFDDAIYLNSNHAVAYHLRGLARQIQGDLEGARDDFDAALLLDSAKSCVFNSRAGLRLQQGDSEGARADSEEAIRLDPHNAVALANHARLRWTFPTEALIECQEAIRLDPACAWSYAIRGSLRAHAQHPYDPQAAAADYQKVMRLEPRLGEVLQADGFPTGEDPQRHCLRLNPSTGKSSPALEMPTEEHPCCLNAIARGLQWLLMGALGGMLAGALFSQVRGVSVEVTEWTSWLLAWGILGGVSALGAGAVGMFALVRSLGGYGDRANPGWPSLCVEPRTQSLLALPFAALWGMVGRLRKRWLRSLPPRQLSHWSEWEIEEADASTRLRRSLAAVSMLGLLHVGVKLLLGSWCGMAGGFVAGWAHFSILPGILLTGLVGLGISVGLIEKMKRPGKRRRMLVLSMVVGTTALAGGLAVLLPGFMAGALAAYLLVELWRRNALGEAHPGASTLAWWGALAGGGVSLLDAEGAFRFLGLMVGGILFWALAGALSGAITGFLLGASQPGRVVQGSLSQRLLGGTLAVDPGKLRLQIASFTGIVGVVVGGGVGLFAGGLFTLLAAVGPELTAFPWIAVLAGGVLGGGLANLYAQRMVGCRALLRGEERLELLLPLPPLVRLFVVGSAVALGAAGGGLLWYEGQALGSPLYWILAGAGTGTIAAAKLRAAVE